MVGVKLPRGTGKRIKEWMKQVKSDQVLFSYSVIRRIAICFYPRDPSQCLARG